MPQELDPLKQELFSYLEKLPEETRTRLRNRDTVIEAGFGTHLDELYGGNWIRAIEDFQFYQFVKTAQRYSNASPKEKEELEPILVQYGLDAVGLPEERVLISLLDKSDSGYTMRLRAIQDYMARSPVVYEEDYRSGLASVLQPKIDIPSYETLEEHVEEVLSPLDEREKRVLQLRFGLENGKSKTLVQVGRVLPNFKTGEVGVTEARVRQIERKALRKLRHPSRSSGVKDFLG